MEMPFGKHKGKEIESLPSSYLHWLAENCDDEIVAQAADNEFQWRENHRDHWED